MNWNKLKTFLIVLFSALNIILIITMLAKDYKETVIPQQTIQDTVDVLKKRGISLDKSIIPERSKNMEGFSMQTLKFEGLSVDVKYPGGEIFELSVPYKAHSLSEVKGLLEKLGILYAEFTTDGKSLKNLRAFESIDDFRIFGNFLDITVLEDKVNIRGKWLVPSVTEGEREDMAEPCQITSILIEFISNPDRPQGNITIRNVDFGYFAPSYTLTDRVETFTVVPCWEITLDTGDKFYYDARNGEYLK